MKKYFIYYEFEKNGKSGSGNMTIDVEIKDSSSIKYIEEYIKNHFNYEFVMVANFIPIAEVE